MRKALVSLLSFIIIIGIFVGGFFVFKKQFPNAYNTVKEVFIDIKEEFNKENSNNVSSSSNSSSSNSSINSNDNYNASSNDSIVSQYPADSTSSNSMWGPSSSSGYVTEY